VGELPTFFSSFLEPPAGIVPPMQRKEALAPFSVRRLSWPCMWFQKVGFPPPLPLALLSVDSWRTSAQIAFTFFPLSAGYFPVCRRWIKHDPSEIQKVFPPLSSLPALRVFFCFDWGRASARFGISIFCPSFQCVGGWAVLALSKVLVPPPLTVTEFSLNFESRRPPLGGSVRALRRS